MVQLLTDRDTIPFDKLGPLGDFLYWISTSDDFNMGFLGWFVGIHTFEALFAWNLASLKDLDFFSKIFWFLQTLVFGFASFEQLCNHPGRIFKSSPKTKNHFETPTFTGWLFQIVFWMIFAGTAISQNFAGTVADYPLIGTIIKAYAENASYKSRCFIFGALIGAHMAEAMFVKHVAWMKGVESNFTRWMWWIQTTYF